MADCNQKEEQNQQQDAPAQSSSPHEVGVYLCGVALLLAMALPLCAQQPRLYREGNTWVEEVTGTLPPAHELRVNTDIGSVEVQGSSPHITYVIRKRSYLPSPEAAKRQFDHLHISVGKAGETDQIEGRATAKNLERMGAEFIVQVPRDLSLVKSADAHRFADVQFDCGDDHRFDRCRFD